MLYLLNTTNELVHSRFTQAAAAARRTGPAWDTARSSLSRSPAHHVCALRVGSNADHAYASYARVSRAPRSRSSISIAISLSSRAQSRAAPLSPTGARTIVHAGMRLQEPTPDSACAPAISQTPSQTPLRRKPAPSHAHTHLVLSRQAPSSGGWRPCCVPVPQQAHRPATISPRGSHPLSRRNPSLAAASAAVRAAVRRRHHSAAAAASPRPHQQRRRPPLAIPSAARTQAYAGSPSRRAP